MKHDNEKHEPIVQQRNITYVKRIHLWLKCLPSAPNPPLVDRLNNDHLLDA